MEVQEYWSGVPLPHWWTIKVLPVCEEFEGELLSLLSSSARQGLKIEHDTQYLSLPPLSSPRQIIDHPLLQMPVVHIPECNSQKNDPMETFIIELLTFILQRGLAPRSKGKARAELRPARRQARLPHSRSLLLPGRER